MALLLPEDIERRLEALADYLADLDDHAAAEREAEEVRAGRSATVPLAEMMERPGVTD